MLASSMIELVETEPPNALNCTSYSITNHYNESERRFVPCRSIISDSFVVSA